MAIIDGNIDTDDKSSFDEHVSSLCKKANNQLKGAHSGLR